MNGNGITVRSVVAKNAAVMGCRVYGKYSYKLAGDSLGATLGGNDRDALASLVKIKAVRGRVADDTGGRGAGPGTGAN